MKKKLSNKKMTLKNEMIAMAFILPALLLFILTKYVPILMGVFISFFDIDIVNLPGDFCGFDNYIRAINDKMFFSSMWHNIKFLIYSLLMCFWPPIVAAILIDEVRKHKTLLRVINA